MKDLITLPREDAEDALIFYVLRFGGRCRDCADQSGVCPTSGLPCEGADKAVRHVLNALRYGIENGFIDRQSLASAPHGGGELREKIARIIEDRCPDILDQMLSKADTPEKRDYVFRNWVGPDVLAKTDAILALAALSQEAEAPHCQKCGGEVHGWICQSCGQDFEENDAGKLVFMAEQEAEPVAWRIARRKSDAGFGRPQVFTTDEASEGDLKQWRRNGYLVQRLIVHPDDRGGEVKG